MKHIVVGTAGHIDHGKSALVRALTGTDPDRLKEEKARGITIDLGFAQYQIGNMNVAFVDVPGHDRFVRNMLAGASGIDGVLLVVAADESVMPQTREHFDICRLLGIRSGIVALTKSDLVDTETIEIVKLETADLLAGSFLEGARVVPVSSKTGVGLKKLTEALTELSERVEERTGMGITRLPIDRAFTVHGFGTVVTGTLVSGHLTADAELELLPVGRRVRVRGLQVHGNACQEVTAGQRVAVNLSSIEVRELKRGDSLVEPNGLEITRRLDADLGLLASASPLKHGARVRFHAGTSETMARISLGALCDQSLNGEAVNLLEAGEEAYARVHLEETVALTRSDRFVIRAYSPAITIAGGRVLDPAPGRGRFRTKAGVERLRRLHSEDPCDVAAAMVTDAGARGLPVDRLIPRAGTVPTDLSSQIGTLVESGRAQHVGSRLLTPEVVATLCNAVRAWVTVYHERRPLEPGLPREEARERFSHLASPAIFDKLVELMVQNSTLTARDHLALATHKVALSEEEERVSAIIERSIKQAGLAPPEPVLVAEENGIDFAIAERMVQYLVRRRVLVRVESQYFHAFALDSLKADVAAWNMDSPDGRIEIDVGTFKERYKVSRKYAIPLLGHLDRERVTRRLSNVRVVL